MATQKKPRLNVGAITPQQLGAAVDALSSVLVHRDTIGDVVDAIEAELPALARRAAMEVRAAAAPSFRIRVIREDTFVPAAGGTMPLITELVVEPAAE